MTDLRGARPPIMSSTATTQAKDRVIIRFAGDSGDGMQLTGDRFTQESAAFGNDLSTPRPEYRFAGLKPGDRWCLCAARFLQAAQEFAAPQVVLAATHIRATDIVPLELLRAHAVDRGA